MVNQGWREFEHTADWGLEVWAPDLAALLSQAALGMYALMGVELADEPRQSRELALDAPDPETLLVEFLSELLFLGESEHLAFDLLEVQVDGTHLEAVVDGAPVLTQAKEVKAVTFHGLEVRETDRGLTTRIVFDV